MRKQEIIERKRKGERLTGGASGGGTSTEVGKLQFDVTQEGGSFMKGP